MNTGRCMAGAQKFCGMRCGLPCACRCHRRADRGNPDSCDRSRRSGPGQRVQVPNMPGGVCAWEHPPLHGLHSHLPQALPGQVAQHEGHLPHLPAPCIRENVISGCMLSVCSLCVASREHLPACAGRLSNLFGNCTDAYFTGRRQSGFLCGVIEVGVKACYEMCKHQSFKPPH